MEFGVVMALLHLGIGSFCTMLVILLRMHKKDRSRGVREKSLTKAA